MIPKGLLTATVSTSTDCSPIGKRNMLAWATYTVRPRNLWNAGESSSVSPGESKNSLRSTWYCSLWLERRSSSKSSGTLAYRQLSMARNEVLRFGHLRQVLQIQRLLLFIVRRQDPQHVLDQGRGPLWLVGSL